MFSFIMSCKKRNYVLLPLLPGDRENVKLRVAINQFIGFSCNRFCIYMIQDTEIAQISKKQHGRNIYAVMKKVCSSGQKCAL